MGRGLSLIHIYKLREHDHISAEINDVALGFYIPAVDVDGVGKGLEGVKADAQRQSANALDLGKGGAQQGVCAAQHKVCVFEVEQHPKAANEGYQQKCPAQGRLLVEVLDAQAADCLLYTSWPNNKAETRKGFEYNIRLQTFEHHINNKSCSFERSFHYE